eukprot:augustus_masked-scaffold_5-processed-gene-4.49-mRNA-1 protein AED:0.38 eAED:0.40 QI:0/-1/0/1/-1/1/1/0/514
MSTAQLTLGSQSGLQKSSTFVSESTAASHSIQALLSQIAPCLELSQLTLSSFGPNGLNKLIINHLDQISVTNHAGTILNDLEVVHPSAKLLVLACKRQLTQFNDATNLVLVFAGELLHKARELLLKGTHVTHIISSYARSMKILLETLPTLAQERGDIRPELLNAVIKGDDIEIEKLRGIVTEGCLKSIVDERHLNVDNIRVSKLLGKGLEDSFLVNGMVLPRWPETATINQPKVLENVRVAVFGTNIEAAQTETTGKVHFSTAQELLNYAKSEEALLEEQILSIINSDVSEDGKGKIKVVISGGTISQMGLHFLEKYDIMAFKVTSKFEIKRLCSTLKALPKLSLSALSAGEIGFCKKLSLSEIGGSKVALFEGEDSLLNTVVVRSSNQNKLAEAEREIGKGTSVIKNLLSSGKVLPGGAATEVALANAVTEVANKEKGMDQHGMKAFAESLKMIKEILNRNQYDDEAESIELWDEYSAKENAFKLAVDAVVTILSVDQLIMSKQAGGPKMPK